MEPLEPVRIVPSVAGAGLVATSAVAFSPDSQRIAYVADLGSGVPELFVQNANVSDPGEPVQVSVGGARNPSWSPDGAVLHYTFDDDDDGIAEFFAVDVSGDPTEPAVHDPGDEGILRSVTFVFVAGEPHEAPRPLFAVTPNSPGAVVELGGEGFVCCHSVVSLQGG